jgi:hypothetical protein
VTPSAYRILALRNEVRLSQVRRDFVAHFQAHTIFVAALIEALIEQRVDEGFDKGGDEGASLLPSHG